MRLHLQQRGARENCSRVADYKIVTWAVAGSSRIKAARRRTETPTPVGEVNGRGQGRAEARMKGKSEKVRQHVPGRVQTHGRRQGSIFRQLQRARQMHREWSAGLETLIQDERVDGTSARITARPLQPRTGASLGVGEEASEAQGSRARGHPGRQTSAPKARLAGHGSRPSADCQQSAAAAERLRPLRLGGAQKGGKREHWGVHEASSYETPLEAA